MSETRAASASQVAWHISTYSSEGSGRCVEAGPFTDGSTAFAVRDSQHRSHGHLAFSRAEWAAFLAGATT
ncbi:hypothetical protein BJF83_01960 [Nocardiopsis sp. CNR-923]|uniref:DUF397 domain-containing protein n=1 Tax=Nocardiopsis sp. CNR-923 TaxID=1904965 RepID=UPI0009662A99|nr:DUF397 domain-containing protein [Nocardiopsis sp. CNR-923]OLT27369.1 hypothetical protein BJF83_01960 [Nocardiopsis sp. CNR-923]